MAQWFWRRRFFYSVNVFYYLPLEKGGALQLNKLESPLPKDALCQVWLKLAQWFWRRRWKCEKFTDRRTDGQTDAGRQVIRKAHLSFQLRWAKNVWFEHILLFKNKGIGHKFLTLRTPSPNKMLNPMTQNFTRPYPAADPGDLGGTFSAGFYQWKHRMS